MSYPAPNLTWSYLKDQPINRAIFLYWINERETIRICKEELKTQKPWSEDRIFQDWKFCNVRREDDKVTRWIHQHWMEPNKQDPNLWFATIVARLFNWPETLLEIGFPTDYENWKEATRTILKFRRDNQKKKVFTGAYLVSTNGVQMDKIDYILDRVLEPIWISGKAPKDIRFVSLESYWRSLMEFDGLGSFMAGQVVADLKFFDPDLKQAVDWWSFAPLGPGSKRGLNRVFNRPLEQSIPQEKAQEEFLFLQKLVEERLHNKLAAHNIQNCLCETDKYIRILQNEGRPRSTYPGAA